jgi:hypothetical protein
MQCRDQECFVNTCSASATHNLVTCKLQILPTNNAWRLDGVTGTIGTSTGTHAGLRMVQVACCYNGRLDRLRLASCSHTSLLPPVLVVHQHANTFPLR